MKPNDLPRITLVMPSFNQAQYLEEAICSVLDQNYPNLEFMILDGGSTDGSKAIIERYSHVLTYWRSQPDEGQSAAIDEGIGFRATGELSGWLNSDDLLLPGSLLSVARAYLEQPKTGLLAGNLVFMDRQGMITGFLRMPSRATWFARQGVFAVSGPGSFFRTQLYRTIGGVRHDLNYVMDNELYLRMLIEGAHFSYLDRYLAAFRRHDQQKTSAFKVMVGKEMKQLGVELQGRYGIKYNSTYSLMLYYLHQMLNGNYLKKRLHLLTGRHRHWREWARQQQYMWQEERS